MKTLLFLGLASVLSFQSLPARAASPEEEGRFLAAAKQAFAKHDADALSALTCWERVPEKQKADGRKQYTRDAAQAVAEVVLINPDPTYPDMEWKDSDGVSYRSNLAVTKQLKITFKGGEFGGGVYPVGEKSGKLFLLEPAPVNK